MKRIFFLLLTVALALLALTGCFGTESHQYTSDCDPFCDCCANPVERATVVEHERETCDSTVCSVCETELAPLAHTYKNDCAPKCLVCEAIRTDLKHTYATECSTACSVCGAVRDGVTHTYSNLCDVECNVCKELRPAEGLEHAWLHDCSTKCSYCDATREAEHVYEFECSVACKLCGATRLVAAELHDYEFGCSSTCRTCGFVRNDNAHAYSDACDQFCDYGCGYDRGEQHVWVGLCNDQKCDACGATKAVAHVDANEDYVCDVCQAVCDHVCYNNDSLDCDRICKVEGCGKALAAHTYSFACDATCDIAGCTTGDREAVAHEPVAACGTVCRYCGEAYVADEVVDHTYDGACDTTCNECGEKRTAIEDHTPSATKGCDVCDVCGESTGFAHTYEFACSAACSVCGAANPTGGHVGLYSCSVECKYCGTALDSIRHTFAYDCSTCCAICGKHVRTDAADAHTDANGDKACDICGEALPTTGEGVLPEHTIPAKKDDE